MKSVKRTLLIALALSTLVATVPVSRAQDSKDNAKPERPPAGQRERRGGGGGAAAFDRMAERLKLTDEQKTKLQPIYQAEMTKMRDVRQDTNLTPEQKRGKVKDIREESLAKWKGVLTAEQFDQFKKMRDQARGPRGVRQGGDAKPPADPEKKQ